MCILEKALCNNIVEYRGTWLLRFVMSLFTGIYIVYLSCGENWLLKQSYLYRYCSPTKLNWVNENTPRDGKMGDFFA